MECPILVTSDRNFDPCPSTILNDDHAVFYPSKREVTDFFPPYIHFKSKSAAISLIGTFGDIQKYVGLICGW